LSPIDCSGGSSVTGGANFSGAVALALLLSLLHPMQTQPNTRTTNNEQICTVFIQLTFEKKKIGEIRFRQSRELES